MKIVLISIVGVVCLAVLLVVLSGFRARNSTSDAVLTPLTTDESSSTLPNGSADKNNSSDSSADQKVSNTVTTKDSTEVNLDEIDLELDNLNLDGLQ